MESKVVGYLLDRSPNAKWYNAVSTIYEFLGDFYQKPREKFIKSLDIKKGETVVDLCSGTGRNIEYLLQKVSPEGKVIAVDNSAGMLKKSQNKFKQNENVFLIHADCQNLSLGLLHDFTDTKKVDHILCSFGYSVLENPEQAYINSLGLLKKNGGYSVIDLFAKNSHLIAKVINTLARAESKRESWKLLESTCKNIRHTRYRVLSGEIFLCTGTKK